MAERKKVTEKTKIVKKPVRKTSARSSQRKITKEASPASYEVTANLPILEHFSRSWFQFQRTVLSYFKIVGVGIGLFVIIGLLGIILALPLMVSSGGSAPSLFSNPSPAQIGGIVLVILWFIASLIAAVAYFTWLPIASIFVLAHEGRPSLRELMIKSRKLLVPYFLISLFAGLLVLGGWALLILPGIVISLLFIFVSFVFVLENKGGVAALKRSYQLVRENFWIVFLRVVIIQVVLFTGSYILEYFALESDVFSFVSFIFSLLGGWFAQVYMYLLYKQIQERVSIRTAKNITWIYIVSALGWLLFLSVLIAAVNGAMNTPSIEKTINILEEA